MHDAVKATCAGMAGDAPGCKEWGESYDQVAQQSMQTCTSLANALTNFGSVLYASGYNYGISNTSNPPSPGIQQVDEHNVAIPTSLCNNGIGIEDRGGVAGFFDGLVSRIVSEFGKLPNGDIGKLDTAESAWTDFSRNETSTSASARISAISALFENMDDTDNRRLIQEHFDTLRASAENLDTGAETIAASVGNYHNETVALGESLSSSINALELTIAVAALGAGVAFLLSLGTSAAVGGAAIAADVAATATTIRSAYRASNLLKVVGLATVAAGAVGVIDAFNDVPNLQ